MTDAITRAHTPTTLLARLIDEPELVRRVRSLSAPVFSRLVRAVGLEDAGAFVALATTEQLVGAFDEDLFRNERAGERERFDPARFVTWLEVLLEAGDSVAAARVAELSEAFVMHAFDSLALVFDCDALRERIVEDDEDGPEADKALESAHTEEIDGYLLVARSPDGWDAVFALLLALDRDHRAFLERVLDRCVRASRSLVEDLGALTTELTEGASLAEDVEAARDERRERAGFVEPRTARSFLAMARVDAGGAAIERDPFTRGYFGKLARVTEGDDEGAEAARLLAMIERAEQGARPKRTKRALPAPSEGPVLEALAMLRERDPARFEERTLELGFLANVLVAGASMGGRRLRPSEAADAALATVALGAALEARARAVTAKSLYEILRAREADLLFRRASAALARKGPGAEGFLRDCSQLEAALASVA